MTMHSSIRLVLGAAAVVGLAGAAGAQTAGIPAQQRLQQSLDAPTFAAVSLVIDDARARGVPVEPLVNRALQATLHRTPGPRIRDAVATLAGRLEVAQASLGRTSSAAEITAGANALAVGVPRETLVEIRTLSPGRPVTVPLGVLTELVVREGAVNRRDVAVSRASRMVVALLRNGATPAQLVSLNDDVEHDVEAGIVADAALDVRTRGVLGTLLQSAAEAERALVATPGGVGSPANRPPPRAPRKP